MTGAVWAVAIILVVGLGAVSWGVGAYNKDDAAYQQSPRGCCPTCDAGGNCGAHI